MSQQECTTGAALPPLGPGELSRLFELLPVGVLLEDEQGQIAWVNRTLEEQLGQSGDTLVGKPLSALALERIPRAGVEGEVYQVTAAGGVARWLISISRALESEPAPRLVRFYLDAQDDRRVSAARNPVLHLIENRPGIDPDTGVLDRQSVTQALASEVSRSRRYENPLCVVSMRVEPCAGVSGEPNQVLQTTMSTTARLLREHTRWVDVLGRWSDWEFVLVLRETNAKAAAQLTDKIAQQIGEHNAARVVSSEPCLRARFGIAEWQRGDDASSVMARARGVVG